NEEHVIFIADLPQLPQPFAPEMIVAAFALDRFDNNRGDIGPAFIDKFPDFRFRFFLALDHVAFALLFRQGKINRWIRNPRPVELGEQSSLARPGVRQPHGITESTVDGVPKLTDSGP